MENQSIISNNNINKKDNAVKVSFYVTYTFLLITATITFIEAMRNKDAKIRHILNLVTCISIAAAFFYTQFIEKIKTQTVANTDLIYKEINLTRYTDWMITTPIMLLVLCLVFIYNSGGNLKAWVFLLILILNYCMLGSRYAGELNVIPKNHGKAWGMMFFILLYVLIYYKFLHNNYNRDNQLIFGAFVVFWAFYIILYDRSEETKNIGYNVLDLFSKCFVGIFLWAYLAKVLKVF
jgi:bacteriorhodopsin